MPSHPSPGERSNFPHLAIIGPNAVEAATPDCEPPTLLAAPAARRLPAWLKRPIPATGGMSFTRNLIAELGLETVCESARCPNRSECWSRRTATFMILGDVCTRPCGFCAVQRGRPEPIALDEPERLAEACQRLGLRHVVITSVTRDDLPDGGADQFRRCVLAVRERTGATIEVLTPDFDGKGELIELVLESRPEVFNHNLETVARLQQHVRRKSQYAVSLSVLAHVKRTQPEIRTKSGLMLGLGETTEEVIETLADLRDRLRPAYAGPVSSAVAAALAGRALSSAGRIRRTGPARARSGLYPRRERPFCSFQLSRRRDGRPGNRAWKAIRDVGAVTRERSIRVATGTILRSRARARGTLLPPPRTVHDHSDCTARSDRHGGGLGSARRQRVSRRRDDVEL